MREPDLKTCPFCGKGAHVQQLKWSAQTWYYVGCSNSRGGCIASSNIFGKFYVSRADAVEAWNRRADDGET